LLTRPRRSGASNRRSDRPHVRGRPVHLSRPVKRSSPAPRHPPAARRPLSTAFTKIEIPSTARTIFQQCR
jgi:hypothetical protein